MDSIDTVIEKCKVDIEEDNEEKFDMKVKNHCSGQNIPKPHRPEKVGRSATRPPSKTDGAPCTRNLCDWIQ